MNLKEEIQNHSFPIASEDVGREDMILNETAERIAEAYAKAKAHDAYWEATRSSFRFAKEPVVLSKQDVDVDFGKWWEENK